MGYVLSDPPIHIFELPQCKSQYECHERMTRCRGLTRHTTLRRCNAILFMDRRLQYLSLICLITNTKNVFAFLFCV
jgi:hypothetical protein